VSPREAPLASEVLGHVVDDLEQIFGGLDTLAQRLHELVARAGTAGVALQRNDLAPLHQVIFHILATHRGLVAGAGVIAAPDLLRDAPRWLEWWWTTAAGTPEALRVNLDPAAPDFFDYTTADWYATPQRTLTRQAAGPYVDYACTGEYAITLSTPILAGDRLLGMAAADVLVSSVERRVLPALMSITHPVVLANVDGRVIASNSPHWTPGLRVAVNGSKPAVLPGPDLDRDGAPSPLRSWVLVDVDSSPVSTLPPNATG
jgi:hypothetical protein